MSKPVDPGAAIAEPRAYCLNCRVDGSIYGVRLCTWHHSVREMRRLLATFTIMFESDHIKDGLPHQDCFHCDAAALLARIPEKP
jgi:hypothetical protein